MDIEIQIVLVFIILCIYGVSALFILVYSFMQLHLVYLSIYSKKNKKQNGIDNFPKITIQLPIFNEQSVVKRLIEKTIAINYPKDKLQIQCLDDSTNECLEISKNQVETFIKQGFDIVLIHREDRTGFKAGALQEGLKTATGEYIAIFDADFLPDADFLIKTLPYFNNETVGMVQTRWTHLNDKYSLITRLQAFGLDAHFLVEQKGRHNGAHFINFNGTAGIWRKSCILESDGWSADTLTEDLDLSYRAQLKGWKFIYDEHVYSPSELPISIEDLKNQQYRWTKGAAQCVKKNLRNTLFNHKLKLSTKIHACFHLLNSTIYLAVFLLCLLSVPLLYIKNTFVEVDSFFYLGFVFIFGLVNLFIFYLYSHYQNVKSLNLIGFFIKFILFLSVSMGLTINNVKAVLEGFFGIKTPFIRTPKRNLIGVKNINSANKFVFKFKFSGVNFFELIFISYSLFGIYLTFHLSDYTMIHFYFMMLFGFSYVFFQSVIIKSEVK